MVQVNCEKYRLEIHEIFIGEKIIIVQAYKLVLYKLLIFDYYSTINNKKDSNEDIKSVAVAARRV